jgi:hypothetical protein
LTSRGLVEETCDSRGKQKLTIRKAFNPSTGLPSQISTEFSAAGWNKATMEYLNSAKKLGTKKLNEILNEARELAPQQEATVETPELSSDRANLCSDEEDDW